MSHLKVLLRAMAIFGIAPPPAPAAAESGVPIELIVVGGVILLVLVLVFNYMHHKNDGNERSTASKMLFGTWLSNGIGLSFIGAIGFFVGMNLRNSLEHQFRRAFGGTDYPGIMMAACVILMLIGISCLGVHYSKKNEK